MGCFLIITKRDFAQLSQGMRQSLSVSTSRSSAVVRVQVHATAYASAQEMAGLIRQHVPSAQVTSADAGERFVPTALRDMYTVEVLKGLDSSLGQVYYSAISSTIMGKIESELGSYFHYRGKASERIAAQVLEQHENLIIYKDQIARAQGVDLPGRSRAGGEVVAEVKTTSSDKDFGQLLGTGYGYRQCSDGWLEALGVDPTRTKVMGVHINPDTRTVSIYRRADANAELWKCVARNKPLSDFNIEANY